MGPIVWLLPIGSSLHHFVKNLGEFLRQTPFTIPGHMFSIKEMNFDFACGIVS